jgi:signal transduction histidine kinase/ligand-binding sensor domain-containing protein
MNCRRTLLFCALLLGFSQDLFAVNPDTTLSQYSHSAWRLGDGILNSAPITIAETTDGYLWIGTSTDLLRFDGARFTSFSDIPGHPHLVQAPIQTLYGASDGSLWIGSASHLYRWDAKTLADYPLPSGSIYTVIEDHSHTIWIGRGRIEDHASGLCRLVRQAVTCLDNPTGQDSHGVGAIAEGRNGVLWLGNDNTIARYASGKIETVQIKTPDKEAGLGGITELAMDPHGGMWVGSFYTGQGLGLEHFDDRALHKLKIGSFDSSNVRTQGLLVDRNGTLWVGTTGEGILKIRGDQVQRYDYNRGLSGNSISQILQDKEGSIWIVTNQGIDRFTDSTVANYSTVQGLRDDWNESVLAARDGRIWLASLPGIDILDNQKVSKLEDKVKVPGTHGTSMFQDRNGDIWLGMDLNLYHLTQGIMNPVLTEQGKPVGLVGRIAEDTTGTLWISIFTNSPEKLLYIKPHDHVARLFPNRLAWSRGLIADLYSGIWVLDRSDTLAHIDNGHVQTVGGSIFGKHSPISLIQGGDGTIYVWCVDGLVVIRGAEIRFTHTRGMPACNIYASTFDQAGSLWAAGLCGLFRIDANQLNQLWSAPTLEMRDYLRFDESDGFNPRLPDFSPAIAKAPDGRLWFSSANGVQVLDPKNLALNQVPPPVRIENLTADRQKILPSGVTHLPSRTRDIELDYTALTFINTAKVLFRYKLQGHDTDWQEAGTRRQAFYTNLTPGHYTFHVIARNASGIWNQKGDIFQFDIAPAWYQTMWFRIIAAALFILALAIAYILRVRTISAKIELRLNARISERMRISRELHDTLLQALQGMILRFSSFTHRVSPEVKAEMERSLDDAEWLLVSGRDRIKEMRGNYSQDGNLAAEIHQITDALFTDDGCKVNVTVQGNPIPLNSIIHDETVWIAREALTNACRHSKAEHLDVQMLYASKEFRLVVEDDGVGVDASAFLAHYNGHFGLLGMRERAEAMGGIFNVQSNNGRGTSIYLSLPARVFASQQNWWDKILLVLKLQA